MKYSSYRLSRYLAASYGFGMLEIIMPMSFPAQRVLCHAETGVCPVVPLSDSRRLVA